ncbi:MAG: CoA transferase [Deltaproteobacteria bacterium]|nr:CoA transferase [Deltaproteobacteria bacterium]
MATGPLAGFRVLELAGIGPVPFAGMLLADLGADVIRVDRTRSDPGATWVDPEFDVMGRGCRSIAVDMKAPRGVGVVLRLVDGCDVLIEGFRPGVVERLGIGPEVCMARNPRLIYGRMTGWGQSGPLAAEAGHDIDYIALTGALHAIGGADKPLPPLNLLADFGGGALYLVVGVLSALLERSRSGKGDVVDAAMVDGVASLMSIFYVMNQNGFWVDRRGENFLDGGAHFYGTYRTADGKYVAVGAIEPQFYGQWLARMGIDAGELPSQHDREGWTAARGRVAEIFATRTRDQWCEVFAGSDACVAPVLALSEVASHPHIQARGTVRALRGVLQAAPAPRLERSSAALPAPAPAVGGHTRELLAEAGYDGASIDVLLRDGVVATEVE